MKIVAIAMQKGGVGKSTIARSLAVAAARAGLTPMILDMDPQQTSDYWGRRREPGSNPAVRFVTANDLDATLQILRTHGCDLVLIDTPPARSAEGPVAIEASDLVLMPCTPTVEALEQLPTTAKVAKACGKPAAVVLNLVTPNSQTEVAMGRAACAKLHLQMAPVPIVRRKIHVEATPLGKTAQELANISPGASEVLALWDWLAAELGFETPAAQRLRRA